MASRLTAAVGERSACVADQGLFQLAWAVALGANSENALDLVQELLAPLRLPDIVIMVKAPLAIVQARLRKRGRTGNRLNRLLLAGPGQLVRAGKLMTAIERLIERMVQEGKPTRLIRLENSSSTLPVASIREIARTVEQMTDGYNGYSRVGRLCATGSIRARTPR